MKKTDIVEKIFLDYNDNFADIINGLVFKGEQKISPDSLANSGVHGMIKADGRMHEIERDVAKVVLSCEKEWKADKDAIPVPMRICFLGVENQSTADPAISVRVLVYDGASYKEQMIHNDKVRREAAKKKSKGEPAEAPMLWKYPVITIVLYFGQEPWKKVPTLREYYQKEIGRLEPELRELVQDYKATVYDIAHLKPEEAENFKGDFRYVVRMLQQIYNSEDPYIPPLDEEIQRPDPLLKLLGALTGKSEFETTIDQIEGREGRKVRDLMEHYDAARRKEGEKKGIAQSVHTLMKTMNLSLEKAMDALLVDARERPEIARLVAQMQ